MPQYIVGTRISTKQQARDVFDPLSPSKQNQPNQNIRSSWLPVDIDWILGRISQTPGEKTYDYMFYCAQNPQRTHVTTFETMLQADHAIARLKNEQLEAPPTEEERMKVDMGSKFDQARDQIRNRENLNRSRTSNTRRGGPPGNLNRRMGR